MIKRKPSEVVFDTCNMILMVLVIIVSIYPLWYVTIASFSSTSAVSSGKVLLVPVEFTLDAFKQMWSYDDYAIWRSYGNTILYSVGGTALSMVLTILGAYPLSKKYLKGKKFLTWLILITMWFGPGMMPNYINLRNLHLLDSRIAIFLIGCISTFNVVLMRTFFESIPDSLEESAKLDGASHFRIMRDIFIPLSVPAIMTISLYYFVGRWNSFFWAMLLLKDKAKIPLQVVLKKLVVEMNANNSQAGMIDYTTTSRETMIYATMVIAVMPMIILYPFIQKYFVKGIMVGAIKG